MLTSDKDLPTQTHETSKKVCMVLISALKRHYWILRGNIRVVGRRGVIVLFVDRLFSIRDLNYG